jgi:hypothetical protein
MTGDQWPPLPAMTVHGDSIVQQGHGNVGKVVHGSEQRVYAAAEELRTLVAELQESGLLGARGEVADQGALEAVVRRDRPRIQRLLDALGAGAQNVLLDVVDGAAAPVVLEILRRVFG